MTHDHHLRILRAATHWARSLSKEFDAHIAACLGNLQVHRAKGGAVTLQGRTDTGALVSICLTMGDTGPELAWKSCEDITAPGFAAIRDTEHRITLPRYLARQLAGLGDAPPPRRPDDPQPELVPA